MMGKPIDTPLVAISIRIYRVLLLAYPAKFKGEYGPHMLQVFGDYCNHVFHQSGLKGMVRLWAVTLFDLFQSLIEEHLQKEIQMKKEDLEAITRLGGWSLMLGAVTFLLLPIGVYMEDNIYDPFQRLSGFYETSLRLFFLATPLLLMVGMLGLRIRYGDKVGVFGKNILLLGAIGGAVVTFTGIAGMAFIEWIWILAFTGPAVSMACLALFGIVALRFKPMQRWNILPLLAGFWFPVLFFTSMINSLLTGEWLDNSISSIDIVMASIQFAALLMLGYALQADAPDEVSVTT